MTVFNDALRVIFDDTNIAVAATYSPPGGVADTIRSIDPLGLAAPCS